MNPLTMRDLEKKTATRFREEQDELIRRLFSEGATRFSLLEFELRASFATRSSFAGAIPQNRAALA